MQAAGAYQALPAVTRNVSQPAEQLAKDADLIGGPVPAPLKQQPGPCIMQIGQQPMETTRWQINGSKAITEGMSLAVKIEDVNSNRKKSVRVVVARPNSILVSSIFGMITVAEALQQEARHDPQNTYLLTSSPAGGFSHRTRCGVGLGGGFPVSSC